MWKSKITPIKVYLIDDTVKTVKIDDSSLVGFIIDKVADSLGIESTSFIEYGLLVQMKNLKAPLWLNRELSLQEQGVYDNYKLTFKKRFFVTDANIDKSNEMQLHLIYTQAKESILSGNYPCEKHQILEFCCFQLQIEHGNIDKKRHTLEWFNEKLYLSPPYQKLKKKLWKEIEGGWEKLINTQVQNAKVRYVQRCRQLPSYGITTFEVKEKDPEKKKLQDVLFGVTRRSVVRMDPETKEIIKAYPLTSIKRYSHSANSFTVDFGNHATGYYTVQTTRGAEISALLDGYIDILLAITQQGANKDMGDAKNIAELEDVDAFFAVAQVSTISNAGVGKYSADDFRQSEFFHGRQEIEMGNTESAKKKMDIDMGDFAQQATALAGSMGGLSPNNAAMPGDAKEDLLAAAANLGRAMGDLLSGLDAPSELVNDRAKKVLGNLRDLISASKNASGETDDYDLLEAGRRIANAIGDIMQACKEVMDDPGNLNARQNLRRAIAALKSAAGYMQGVVNGVLADSASEQLLLESAKAVAEAIERMTKGAGKMSDLAEDPNARKEMLAQSERANRTGNGVYDCASMLAPIIVDPLAKQQLLSAARNAKADSDKLLRLANAANLPSNELAKLLQAAKKVSDSLMQLAAATDCASSAAAKDQEQMNIAAKAILDGINDLKRAQGDASAMNNATKNIARNVPALLHAAKRAAISDPSRKNEILDAARKLAEASKGMLSMAKPAIANPGDNNAFKNLLLAAREVADATRDLLGDKSKLSVFTEVRTRAKEAAAASAGFSNTTRSAIPEGSDQGARKQLYESSEVSSRSVQKLLDALQQATAEPDNLIAQSRLVAVAKDVSKPLAHAINNSRLLLPKIEDVVTRKAVKFSSTEAGKALSALVLACSQASEVTGDKDVDEAFEELGAIKNELDNAILDSQVGALHAKQPREEAEVALKKALSNMQNSIENLQHAHEVGVNAKKTAYAMADVAQAATQIAANSSGEENQTSILNSAKDLIPDLLDLIRKAKGAQLGSQEDDPSLLEGAKNIYRLIKDLLSTTQKGTGAEECAAAAIATQNALSQLSLSPSYQPGDIVTMSAEVESKARAIALATGKMQAVTSDKKSTPDQLKSAAQAIANAMPALVNSVNRITTACNNSAAQGEIVRVTQVLGGHAVKVLENAVTARIDDKAAKGVEQEHKYVLENVQKLLTAITAATPGIQELEKADKMLKDARRMQDDIPEGQYGLLELTSATERLGDNAVKMIQSASTETDKLGTHGVNAARSIADIINISRSFSPLAESVGYAVAIEEAAKEMEADPSTIVDNTRSIAKAVQALNKAMQGVVTEVDQPLKVQIKDASMKIGPDLKELIQVTQQIKSTQDPRPSQKAANKLAVGFF